MPGPRAVEAKELDHDLVLSDDELEVVLDGTFEGLGEVVAPYWKLKPGESAKLVKRIRRAASAKGSKTKKALEAFEQKAPFFSLAVYAIFVILLPRIQLMFGKIKPAAPGQATPARTAPTQPTTQPPAAPARGPSGNAGNDGRNGADAPKQNTADAARPAAGSEVVGYIGPPLAELAGDASHHQDGRAAGRTRTDVDDFFRPFE